jgi:hypothetical protein
MKKYTVSPDDQKRRWRSIKARPPNVLRFYSQYSFVPLRSKNTFVLPFMLTHWLYDGKPELVQAASVSIHGLHEQYVENIHSQALHV